MTFYNPPENEVNTRLIPLKSDKAVTRIGRFTSIVFFSALYFQTSTTKKTRECENL